jgi:hypothetical protein
MHPANMTQPTQPVGAAPAPVGAAAAAGGPAAVAELGVLTFGVVSLISTSIRRTERAVASAWERRGAARIARYG